MRWITWRSSITSCFSPGEMCVMMVQYVCDRRSSIVICFSPGKYVYLYTYTYMSTTLQAFYAQLIDMHQPSKARIFQKGEESCPYSTKSMCIHTHTHTHTHTHIHTNAHTQRWNPATCFLSRRQQSVHRGSAVPSQRIIPIQHEKYVCIHMHIL
jgi:hypothetical protein